MFGVVFAPGRDAVDLSGSAEGRRKAPALARCMAAQPGVTIWKPPAS
jgi:hypothetical protein